MAGERFTAWLSADERTALHALATEVNASDNWIVRLALRAVLYDKPIPAYVKSAAEEVTRVTQITEVRTGENGRTLTR